MTLHDKYFTVELKTFQPLTWSLMIYGIGFYFFIVCLLLRISQHLYFTSIENIRTKHYEKY